MRSSFVIALTISLIFLSACGGGGSGGRSRTIGGGGSGTTVSSAPSGTVFTLTRGAGLETAAPTYTTTGATFGTSTANATATVNSDGSLTVRVPADASSSGAADSFRISSASFTSDPQPIYPSGTKTALVTTAGSQQLHMEKFGASQNLQYSEYGYWDAPDNGTGSGNGPTFASVIATFAYGIPTTTMPVTGAAAYTGEAQGIAFSTVGVGGTTTAGAFSGFAQLNANLASNTISGTITNINFASNTFSGGLITGTMNNINLSAATISGNKFSGTGIAAGPTAGTGIDISGANSGRFGGGFYGPSAREVAGTFQLSGGPNSAKVIGSFGAHQ